MGFHETCLSLILSLVILAASVFETSCGKTDRQAHKRINAAENLTMRQPSSSAIIHIIGYSAVRTEYNVLIAVQLPQ